MKSSIIATKEKMPYNGWSKWESEILPGQDGLAIVNGESQICLDIDIKNGENKEASEFFKKHEKFLQNALVETKNAGFHSYFIPKDFTLPKSVIYTAFGEVRTGNSYQIIPSTHPSLTFSNQYKLLKNN